MGTLAKVEFESQDIEKPQQLLKMVVDEMNRIDRLMSPFKSNSELSKLNQHAFSQPIKISDELFVLLEKSLYFLD